MTSKTRFVGGVNAALLIAAAIYFFILPLGLLVQDLTDPGLHNGQTPAFAYRWHRSLSQRYQPWAQERFVSGQTTLIPAFPFAIAVLILAQIFPRMGAA